MKARLTVLAVLAVAITVTAVAGAGPAVKKQRVVIDMKFLPAGTFKLTPVYSGPLEADSGSITNVHDLIATAHSRSVLRGGQTVTVYSPAVWVLKGKLGTLRIREKNEWLAIGSDSNKDGALDEIAQGTWTVVGGTGQYAHLSGSGGSAHEGLGYVWFGRHEGFVTAR